jgi:hypothetical protein
MAVCSCVRIVYLYVWYNILLLVMFDSYNIVGDIVYPEAPTGPAAEEEMQVIGCSLLLLTLGVSC